MTKEEFKEIVSVKVEPDDINYIKFNAEVQRNRFACGKKAWVLEDINQDGNAAISNEKGDRRLCLMYQNNYFTDEQWEELLPDICYRDFNKDFDKVVKKVLPLFDKIKEYWEDINLEIWQGIFSFGTHWRTQYKAPEESINKPENGKLYCDTLLEIYPIFKELVDKYECGQYTLYRFVRGNNPILCR